MDVLTSPMWLRRWAVASLLANMGIVLTGALVRLTKSGLGCPSWPQCFPESYVPVPEAGWHGAIEFGNRLLTFVLAAVAVGMALAAWRARQDGRPRTRLRVLSIVVGLGIAGQAVVGGLSVLAGLNPWIVGLHMVLSIGLIVACTVLVHDAYGLAPTPVPRPLLWAVRGVFVLAMLMMYLGTVVTGAGPHSGDGAATRNGLELTEVARAHSVAMWSTIALTVLVWAWARDHVRVRRAAVGILAVAAVQGAIGYAQYLTHLPLGLVLAHMLGTTLFTVAVSHLLLGVTAADQVSNGSSAAAMKTTAR